jgi:hypothetical protein
MAYDPKVLEMMYSLLGIVLCFLFAGDELRDILKKKHLPFTRHPANNANLNLDRELESIENEDSFEELARISDLPKLNESAVPLLNESLLSVESPQIVRATTPVGWTLIDTSATENGVAETNDKYKVL